MEKLNLNNLEAIENNRLRYQKKPLALLISTIIIYILGLILVITGFIIMIKSDKIISLLFIYLGFSFWLIGLGLIFLTIKFKKIAENWFKNSFVEIIMNSYFKEIKYQSGSGISPDLIMRTGMIMNYDWERGNDYLSGEYENLYFIVSDVIFEKVVAVIKLGFFL